MTDDPDEPARHELRRVLRDRYDDAVARIDDIDLVDQEGATPRD